MFNTYGKHTTDYPPQIYYTGVKIELDNLFFFITGNVDGTVRVRGVRRHKAKDMKLVRAHSRKSRMRTPFRRVPLNRDVSAHF